MAQQTKGKEQKAPAKPAKPPKKPSLIETDL